MCCKLMVCVVLWQILFQESPSHRFWTPHPTTCTSRFRRTWVSQGQDFTWSTQVWLTQRLQQMMSRMMSRDTNSWKSFWKKKKRCDIWLLALSYWWVKRVSCVLSDRFGLLPGATDPQQRDENRRALHRWRRRFLPVWSGIHAEGGHELLQSTGFCFFMTT